MIRLAPKIVDSSATSRSSVKDPAKKVALQRLRTLELASKFKNITRACREQGMDRTSFYEWKRRYETLGLDGLLDLPPVRKSHPNAVPAHIRQAVLDLSFQNPAWGSKRLSFELREQGMAVSNFAVQTILKKHGRGQRFERFLAVEVEALKGKAVSPELVKELEKLNPCFKERHVESTAPGELVSMDTFFVGTFKGIGRVYLLTAVDTFGSYAFGMLATQRTSMRAAELLYGQVMPFYEEHSLALKAILTDNGTEFCGREDHPFERVCREAQLQHRRTKVRRPQTNGFVERFHRTILEEFFRKELRHTHFVHLEDLELALQGWIVHYNTKRPHQGYRNMGKCPYQTVEQFIHNVSQES